ncbi:hypothetical protein RUND412_011308 [Rhizina undulata]
MATSGAEASNSVLKFTAIDPQGDVIIELGPPRRTFLRVSSKTLCLASPVFADELPRILKANPPPSNGPNYLIPLPDDPEAFTVMTKILHFQAKGIPRDNVPFGLIAKTCVSALRYDLADTIGPWMDRWVRPWLHTVGEEGTIDKWLAIALVCENQDIFYKLTQQLLLTFTDEQIMTPCDFDAVMPPAIKAEIAAKRAVVIKQLVGIAKSFLDRYLTPKRICVNSVVSFNCDAQILGSIVKGFLKQGLFPIPENGPYPGLTVVGIASALKNLNICCEDGHEICLAEMKADLDKVNANVDEMLQAIEGLDVRFHVWSTYPQGSRHPMGLGIPSDIANVEDINNGGQSGLAAPTTPDEPQNTSAGLGITVTAAPVIDTKQVKGRQPAVLEAINNQNQSQVQDKGHLRHAAHAQMAQNEETTLELNDPQVQANLKRLVSIFPERDLQEIIAAFRHNQWDLGYTDLALMNKDESSESSEGGQRSLSIPTTFNPGLPEFVSPMRSTTTPPGSPQSPATPNPDPVTPHHSPAPMSQSQQAGASSSSHAQPAWDISDRQLLIRGLAIHENERNLKRLLLSFPGVGNRLMVDVLYHAGWNFVVAREKLIADGYVERSKPVLAE